MSCLVLMNYELRYRVGINANQRIDENTMFVALDGGRLARSTAVGEGNEGRILGIRGTSLRPCC